MLVNFINQVVVTFLKLFSPLSLVEASIFSSNIRFSEMFPRSWDTSGPAQCLTGTDISKLPDAPCGDHQDEAGCGLLVLVLQGLWGPTVPSVSDGWPSEVPRSGNVVRHSPEGLSLQSDLRAIIPTTHMVAPILRGSLASFVPVFLDP